MPSYQLYIPTPIRLVGAFTADGSSTSEFSVIDSHQAAFAMAGSSYAVFEQYVGELRTEDMVYVESASHAVHARLYDSLIFVDRM